MLSNGLDNTTHLSEYGSIIVVMLVVEGFIIIVAVVVVECVVLSRSHFMLPRNSFPSDVIRRQSVNWKEECNCVVTVFYSINWTFWNRGHKKE